MKLSPSTTNTEFALRALAPWQMGEYPGRLGVAAAILKGANRYSIRHWRRGTRPPPQWAIDALTSALDSRITEMVQARNELTKEKGRQL